MSDASLAAALAASPNVLKVTKTERWREFTQFIVIIRDTLSSRGAVGVTVTNLATGDSAPSLSVSVGWLGTLQTYPDAQKHRWAQLGAALLAELRGACAPHAPDAVECEEHGLGRAQSRGCQPTA